MLALLLAVVLAVPAWAEQPRACKRACREAIGTCADWRAPLKRKQAKRICKKELLPNCALDGVVECERYPHYKGSYVFVGTKTGGTCDWPPDFPGATGPLSLGLTVHNRGREEIDASMGATEFSGTGATLPWSIHAARGDCLASGSSYTWCAGGRLTVDGLPPRTPRAPHPRATLVFDLVFTGGVPAPCSIVYTGELTPAD